MRMRVAMGILVPRRGRLRSTRSSLRLLFPEFFPGQLFFTGGDHIQLGGADAAAVHPGNLQAGVDAQGRDRPGEYLRRNSGVQQGAQEHIAADSGKAF